MSQMVRGVTYRPITQVEVIREGLKLTRPITLGPLDRFRCDGGTRASYWFQRQICWGGLRQVHGLLNGEPVTLRVDSAEQAVWQVAEPSSRSGGAA
jgi:hypothetical protein